MPKPSRKGKKRNRNGNVVQHTRGVILDETQQHALDKKRQETLESLIEEQEANIRSRIETFLALMKFSLAEKERCGACTLESKSHEYACTVARVWQKGWSTLKQCGRDGCYGFCACIYDARLMVARNQAKSLSECFAQMTICIGKHVDALGLTSHAERLERKYELLRKFLDASWDPPKQRAASTRLVCKNAPKYEPFRKILGDVVEHPIPEGKQVGFVLDYMNGKQRNEDQSLDSPPRKRIKLHKALTQSTRLHPLPALENDIEMKTGSVTLKTLTNSFELPPLPSIPLESLQRLRSCDAANFPTMHLPPLTPGKHNFLLPPLSSGLSVRPLGPAFPTPTQPPNHHPPEMLVSQNEVLSSHQSSPREGIADTDSTNHGSPSPPAVIGTPSSSTSITTPLPPQITVQPVARMDSGGSSSSETALPLPPDFVHIQPLEFPRNGRSDLGNGHSVMPFLPPMSGPISVIDGKGNTQGNGPALLIPLSNCFQPPCHQCIEKDIRIKAMVAQIQKLEEEQRQIRNGAAALLNIGSVSRIVQQQ